MAIGCFCRCRILLFPESKFEKYLFTNLRLVILKRNIISDIINKFHAIMWYSGIICQDKSSKNIFNLLHFSFVFRDVKINGYPILVVL